MRRPVSYVLAAVHGFGHGCRCNGCRRYLKVDFHIGQQFEVTYWFSVN